MIERSFEIDGLRLSALEWRGDGMPLIALHGWLDNAASFVPLAQYLAGCHLLALELPGHGHSDHLPRAAHYHLADNLRWLGAVADAMEWPRFALLGHSLGAAVASLAAAMMPQRVVAIGLLDGLGPIAYTAQQEVERVRQLLAGGGDARSAREGRPFRDLDTATRVRQRHGRFVISGEAARMVTERNLQRVDGGYRWRYDDRLTLPSSHYYSEEQVRGILGSIASPALLIRAGQGALSAWPGFAARCAALPGLRQLTLPGGHYLHMEQPQQVAEQLLAFFRDAGG